MPLKMKQLPKAEYKLMRLLIAEYSLDKDPAELFACALRLVYEVLHMQGGHVSDGQQWWVQIINQYRSAPDEQREYTLD
jgi:hypothetical protein